MRHLPPALMLLLALLAMLTLPSTLTLVHARDYRMQSFEGSLTADEIVYVSIRIPRHSNSVRLKIHWNDNFPSETETQLNPQNPAARSRPSAFLRYNGVPSFDLFDAEYVVVVVVVCVCVCVCVFVRMYMYIVCVSVSLSTSL